MKTLLSIIFAGLFCLQSLAQTAPAKKSPTPTVPKSCEQQKKESYAQGYVDGLKQLEEERKKAKVDGYLEGYGAGRRIELQLLSTELAMVEKPIPIQLVVEEFDGSSAYQLASAEIVQTHFSAHLQVVPNSRLYLYITGTDRLGNGRTQTITVAVKAAVQHLFIAKAEQHLTPGGFVFSSDGFTLANYSEAQAAQKVREMVYQVITKFLKTWDETIEKQK